MWPFSKQESYLGIDLGSTSIKLVELKKSNQTPTLVTFGYGEKNLGDIVRGDPKEVEEKTVALLKKLYKQTGAKSKKAITALPNFAVFSSLITIPKLSSKEIKSAIIYEAKKILPLPIEEVILDWKIIEEFMGQRNFKEEGEKIEMKEKNVNYSQEKMYRILINAASRDLVQRYVDIFSKTDLELLSLETEGFALSRVFIGKEKTTAMIIDTSAVSTDIMIIENGIPILSRSIDIGGVDITKKIAQRLNVNFNKAEQIKKDVGLAGSEKLHLILEEALKSIIDETKYAINLYQAQSSKNIEKIILSGGSAYLPGLDQYIEKNVNIKVFVGNPWSRIAYPKELESALIETAPRFSVAIGLALRELE